MEFPNSQVTCWSTWHYGQTAGVTLTRVSLPTWQASLLRRELIKSGRMPTSGLGDTCDTCSL